MRKTSVVVAVVRLNIKYPSLMSVHISSFYIISQASLETCAALLKVEQGG